MALYLTTSCIFIIILVDIKHIKKEHLTIDFSIAH
jgi:hypothetical protein